MKTKTLIIAACLLCMVLSAGVATPVIADETQTPTEVCELKSADYTIDVPGAHMIKDAKLQLVISGSNWSASGAGIAAMGKITKTGDGCLDVVLTGEAVVLNDLHKMNRHPVSIKGEKNWGGIELFFTGSIMSCKAGPDDDLHLKSHNGRAHGNQ